MKLSPREMQIAELIAQGYKDREISQNLGLTLGGLRTRISIIYVKAGVCCKPKPRENFI